MLDGNSTGYPAGKPVTLKDIRQWLHYRTQNTAYLYVNLPNFIKILHYL